MKKCGQEEGQIKNGRTKVGSQRYKCKHCEKTYTTVKKELITLPKLSFIFLMLFRFILRFVTKEFIALLTTNLKLLLLNLLMLISDIIFLLFIVNPDIFFVLLILFSLSFKFLFLLSINFLLLNSVSNILNIILLFIPFYFDFSCQLSWGSLRLFY